MAAKSNNIPDRFLQKIKKAKKKQLETLDLSDNWDAHYRTTNRLTEIPPKVFDLTQLKVLIIQHSKITHLPESLGKLINLTTLDLRYNQLITLPESLGELTNLTTLNLSCNQLTTLPVSLGYLSPLDSSSYQSTTLPESFGNLTNLTTLDLSAYQLTNLPESFGNLTNLTTLDLSGNQLTNLPESFGNLTNLATLNLSGNQLTNLPESFGNLTNLTTLDLSGNQLTNLPESFGNLTNLTTLNLRYNQLISLPESFGSLTNLTELNLSCHQLSNLPESLSKLTNLTELNLRNNQLTNLPESFGNLTNLTELNLSGNQLTNLPKSFGNLTNLTTLFLSINQLTNLPESFGNLTNLTTLFLDKNKLTNLPESLGNLTNLTTLDLKSNPLYNPPIEVASQGIGAIREYFRQLKEEGKDYIYEAKLLIVGEPGAGKTTLAKKIQDSKYQLQSNEPSTEGIDVIKWSFPLDEEREFKVNIWDFGGQEIYHATHQFFLTKRSLYALVVDTRKEDTDFYYWLNVVELLSENSPLLIIKNEQQDRQREINQRALKRQFENFEKILATNLATNRGLEGILKSVQRYINDLPHIGQTLPKTWVKVRESLENDSRNYISLQEYLDICDANGFTRYEDKLQLSGYLHDLGVCLHFQDKEDSILYKTVILKPEWGTDAVYKVLDSKQVIKNQGCFTRNDLKNIWQDEKYAFMGGELLELMKKFQLCYEIPSKKDTFIAPQLLSDNQPECDWNQDNNLILRYKYPDFMPKGIISRFIVIMHQYIDQQKYVWKSGVILNKDNTRAEVIEYYGKREIVIRAIGDDKRDLMTIITHEIDNINNSYKKLNYEKLIPCNCEKCQQSKDKSFYDFEILKKFRRDGQSIQCQKSYKMVEPLSLIDDVFVRSGLDKAVRDGLEEKEKEFLSDSNQSIVSITVNKPQQQQGNNNTVSNITQSHSGHGDNVGRDKNTTNIYNSQDLKQAAADIQALLEQLEETYPTNTTTGKMAIATEAIQRIDNDPKLASRIFSALKAGGTSALDSFLNHPAASFVIGALEDWQQSKNSPTEN